MTRIGAASATSVRSVSPLVARSLPFGLYMAFLAAVPLVAGIFPAFDIRWLYPAKIAAVATMLLLLWPGFRELHGLRLAPAEAAWALAVGVAVFTAWINMDLPGISLLAQDAAGYDPRDADGAIDWPLAGFRLAGAALVVPVMEELFWRSLVMRWLDRHDFLAVDPSGISLRALLASSVVFGFEHQLWLAGIVAGLAYGQLYRLSGKLWLPILAHAVTNGLLGVWVLSSGQWRFW